MRLANSSSAARGRTLGVIETLSAGYGVLNQQLALLLVPILLDLFLWRGPRLIVSSLVGKALMATPAGIPPESAAVYDRARQALMEGIDRFNVFSLLSTTLLGVPSLMAGREGVGPQYSVTHWGQAVAAVLAVAAAGMLLGCLFYGLITQQVRDGRISLRALPPQVLRSWLSVFLFFLLIMGLGLVAGVPISLVLGAVASGNIELAGFLLALVGLGVVWIQFWLFFAPDAIFVSQVGPLRAIRNSIAVARANPWPALLLVIIIVLILAGMPIVWDSLASNPAGTLVGIVGSAYVSTGLAAASMIFYLERYRVLAGEEE